MFYDKFKFLCDEEGISCTRATLNMGLSNATATKWKKTGAVPESATLAKIAKYFSVPIGFFLDDPPFNQWGLINQNRKSFLYHTGFKSGFLNLTWGIDKNNPDNTPAKDFIAFLAEAIEIAYPIEDGEWVITLKPSFQNVGDALTLESGRKRKSIDEAFFRVVQSAQEKGFSPEDMQMALDFLEKVRKRNQES